MPHGLSSMTFRLFDYRLLFPGLSGRRRPLSLALFELLLLRGVKASKLGIWFAVRHVVRNYVKPGAWYGPWRCRCAECPVSSPSRLRHPTRWWIYLSSWFVWLSDSTSLPICTLSSFQSSRYAWLGRLAFQSKPTKENLGTFQKYVLITSGQTNQWRGVGDEERLSDWNWQLVCPRCNGPFVCWKVGVFFYFPSLRKFSARLSNRCRRTINNLKLLLVSPCRMHPVPILALATKNSIMLMPTVIIPHKCLEMELVVRWNSRTAGFAIIQKNQIFKFQDAGGIQADERNNSIEECVFLTVSPFRSV